MKFKFLINFVAICFWFAHPAISQEIGIATGNKNGTYYRIGEDIKKIARQVDANLNINVIETQGALENIELAKRKQGVQLALVHADTLYFIIEQAKTNKEMQNYVNKMRIVFPLYSNEVHILALNEINNFDDLQNKKVAIGPKGSGTYLTSTMLFQLSGIKPYKDFNYDAPEALEKLRSGEIDAMIYVVGQPTPIFENLDEKMHFVPVTNDKILQYYKSSKIKKGSYKWIDADVPTVSIKSVLMTYDYRQENCQNVKKIAKIIRDNIQCLKQFGHKKWQDVNFNDPIPRGWEPYGCAHDGLLQEADSRTTVCPARGKKICYDTCDALSNPLEKSLCPMHCDAISSGDTRDAAE